MRHSALPYDFYGKPKAGIMQLFPAVVSKLQNIRRWSRINASRRCKGGGFKTELVLWKQQPRRKLSRSQMGSQWSCCSLLRADMVLTCCPARTSAPKHFVFLSFNFNSEPCVMFSTRVSLLTHRLQWNSEQHLSPQLL